MFSVNGKCTKRLWDIAGVRRRCRVLAGIPIVPTEKGGVSATVLCGGVGD